MDDNALNAFLVLFGTSSAVCLAYLALPDYRYRDSITDYFSHFIKHQVRTSPSFDDDANTAPESVRDLLLKERARQRELPRSGQVIEADRTEAWLDYLLLLDEMPKGHVPIGDGQFVKPSKSDRRKERNENWFVAWQGLIFRWLFLQHRDNFCVTVLACLSTSMLVAIVLAIVLPLEVTTWTPQGVISSVFLATAVGFGLNAFRLMIGRLWRSKMLYMHLFTASCCLLAGLFPSWMSNDANINFVLMGVLLVVGLPALIMPPVFAYLGRVVVCKSARVYIHTAVKSFLDGVLIHELGDWNAQIKGAVKDRPAAGE